MKIVVADKLDSIADYRIAEAQAPVPAAGQARIRVARCGMGYVDALVALGGYQVKPPLPFTPGQDFAGVVDRVGAGVTSVAVGDRVMASSFGGGLAEAVVVPEHAINPIPDAMSFAQAAAFRVNYVTALHGLADRARLAEGERLLVLGAAGGVGLAAVQIGRLLGAEVIACASTPQKRDFARNHGADHVLDTEESGWRDRLKDLCGGGGPDAVFDPVCGPLFEPAFRSLVWGGRHLVIGFVGGEFPRLAVNLPLMKGAALVGVDVRQFFEREGERAAQTTQTLLGWVGDGCLVPQVGREFPLKDFAAAMELALSGQALGKSVIAVGDP